MSHIILACGSAARGDTNARSDIDIVCIWKGSRPKFSELKQQYGEIMFYSEETILKMRGKGSLFLTHLDVEGKFISGSIELMELFSGFRPTQLQLEENISRTRDFIKNIKWYPSGRIGGYWLLDVLYVSLRNCIYCQNAINGIYKFGYEAAAKEFGITPSDLEFMLKIREGKYCYRSGLFSEEVRLDASELENICAKIIGGKVSLKQGGKTDWSSDWSNDYWSERLIERAIINEEHSDQLFMKKLRNHNYNRFSLRNDVFSIILSHQKRRWNDYVGLN